MGPIVLAANAAYAMPLAVTLRSLADANRRAWPLRLHVLCDGFSDELRARVEASLPANAASIAWVPIDVGEFRGLSETHSLMAYARLLIPRLFPPAVSRVLYLDADLLVLDDLEALWNVALGECVVGAVRDYFLGDLNLREPDMPQVRDVFNSGVLVIALDRWRQQRISETALEHLTRHPSSPHVEQDALNVACDGRWQALDSRWNFHDHWERRIVDVPPRSRPAIVHFITPRKPWLPRSLNPNAALYDSFRQRTAFKRNRFEIVGDAVQTAWYRCRRRLGRSSLLRPLKNAL